MTDQARLYHISYFSRCRIDGPDDVVESEVQRLLVTARHRNLELGITGSLLFMDGCFAQILEGQEDDLDTLYADICRDTRHSEVALLSRHPLDKRAFPGFAMHYSNAKPDAVGEPGGLIDKLRRALNPASSQPAA